MRQTRSVFYPFFAFIGLNLALLSLSRLALGLWQADRVAKVDGWLPLMLQGVRIDIVTMSYLFGLPLLLSLFFAPRPSWRLVTRLWFTAMSVFLLFMEISTPAFIQTYDFRPNRLFIEYLIYPKEVFTMLIEGHLVATLLAPLFSGLAAWIFWRVSGNVTANIRPMRWRVRPIAALLTIAVAFAGARSSLQHRGINPAMVAFSADSLVNSLVLNSGYSVIYAVSQLKDEDKSSEIYGKMDSNEMFKLLREANYRPESAYVSAELPSLTRNVATYQGKPRNIVILLQESLGAQFIGALGGKPLSPNIDKLAQEGWFFENLYATGTRSVRGIEAVTAGFTPTPARAVVKLAKSQHNFFTLAELLRQKGYETSFIYGGEKHFDNMASFFYGNGFKTIIDQTDYKNPQFKATWGVSDEDLFIKANETFTALQQAGKPFFSLVFSSSNHDPFEFPDGKIELYEQPKATRNNAAKYADYAVGKFFEMAKKSNYWQDTLFIVIADHDSRVGGASLVPIRHFHIPALILGADVKPRRDNRLVSQIDIGPTLLSLAGISGDYPMIGYDLTQNVDPNRALMQYDQNQAFMQGGKAGLNDVVILQPNTPAKGYQYDVAKQSLSEKTQPQALKSLAMAYAQFGSYMYNKQLYRLPNQGAK